MEIPVKSLPRDYVPKLGDILEDSVGVMLFLHKDENRIFYLHHDGSVGWLFVGRLWARKL